jgi:hypothetical protein
MIWKFVGASILMAPLAAQGSLLHVVMCGKSKPIYEDPAGESVVHPLLLGDYYSDTAALNQLESDAAEHYTCRGKCDDNSACSADVSNTYSTISHQSTGNGMYDVTTTGLVITFKCPCPDQ